MSGVLMSYFRTWPGWRLTGSSGRPVALRIWVRPRAGQAACGGCGQVSARVHSRYERRLVDTAIGGGQVQLRLRVRRFFCDIMECPARTFVEQVTGLTTPYARQTPLARRSLETIGLALAGR